MTSGAQEVQDEYQRTVSWLKEEISLVDGAIGAEKELAAEQTQQSLDEGASDRLRSPKTWIVLAVLVLVIWGLLAVIGMGVWLALAVAFAGVGAAVAIGLFFFLKDAGGPQMQRMNVDNIGYGLDTAEAAVKDKERIGGLERVSREYQQRLVQAEEIAAAAAAGDADPSQYAVWSEDLRRLRVPRS